MNVKDLKAWLDTCQPDMLVLIKRFGDVESDEDDAYEDVVNIEIEQVSHLDTLVISGH